MRQLQLLIVFVSVAAAAEPVIVPLDDAARRETVSRLTKDELAQAMRQTPHTPVQLGLAAVETLGGTYKYTMVKQERVNGTLLPEQEVVTHVRDAPFAVRLHYVKGPASGRKLVYNEQVNKAELRVREGGLVGRLGALWIDTEGSLARGDSNHSVRMGGMRKLLTRLKRDQDRAAALGGSKVEHEGWDARGNYCVVYTLPPKQGFDHTKTRICIDLALGMPTKVEGFDPAGQVLERYEFSAFEKLTTTDEFFDPEKARL